MILAKFVCVFFFSLCLSVGMAMGAKAPAKAKIQFYAVQFEVPQSKEEVWNFVEMISNLGFPAYMYSEESGKKTLYYAQMGTFRTVEEAADAARLLSKKVKTKYDLVYANTNTPVVPKENPANDQAPAKPPALAPEQAVAKAPVPAEPPASEPATQFEPQKIAAPVPATALAQAKDKIFLVQIYSFASLDNAKETAKNYKRMGHAPTIYKLFDNAGKEWYAVSIGYAQSYEEAARIAKKFAEKENKSALINKVDAEFVVTRVVEY